MRLEKCMQNLKKQVGFNGKIIKCYGDIRSGGNDVDFTLCSVYLKVASFVVVLFLVRFIIGDLEAKYKKNIDDEEERNK